MNFILEYNRYYSVGDIVLIQYWYNDMITPVKIVDIQNNKYTISHNVEKSKIKNAPNEIIKNKLIISKAN